MLSHQARTWIGLVLAIILIGATGAQADVVTDANAKAAEIASRLPGTPPAVRAMAIVQVSVFEAVNAVSGRYPAFRAKLNPAPGASVDAAVAAATRGALLKLVPSQQAAIEADYQAALKAVPDGTTKTAGIAGFEKYVALKMIHPNFAEDEQFIQMLVDEAKIAVQLTHGNIAQTFDLGRVGASRDEAREWLELLDGIRISQGGPGIVVHASIPAKTMESFVAQMIASRPPAGEARAPVAAAAPAGPQTPAGRPGAVAPAAPGSAASQAKTVPRKPVESSRKESQSTVSAPPGDRPSRPAPEPQSTRTPSDGAP